MNRKIKKVTFNIIIVAALLCGFAWVVSRFVHLGRVEYTDNAQVRQHIVPVNSRVQGFIKEIRFEEYRHVRKGDTLAIIEDAEYRLRVAQAEADLQNARVGKTAMNTSISTLSNNLEVSDAGIAEVEVLMRNAGKDYERYQKLVEQKAVTRREYDQVKANYESLKAKYDMLTRQKRSTALTRDEQSQRLAQTEAGIRLAEAALERTDPAHPRGRLRNLGVGQLQGNPDGPHCRGNARGHHRRRRAGRRLPRPGGGTLAGHGGAVFPCSAGQLGGQFRQGGAARARENRFHRRQLPRDARQVAGRT